MKIALFLVILIVTMLGVAQAELPQYVIHVLDIPGIYPTVTGINNQAMQSDITIRLTQTTGLSTGMEPSTISALDVQRQSTIMGLL